MVSTHWNILTPDTRHALIGAGKVTGVVLSPVGVGQIKTLVTKAPQTPSAKTLALSTEGQAAQAYISNNFHRDGADPALMKQMLDTAALSATHNTSGTEVILGRYIPGSINSYEQVAQARGATYFALPDSHWNNTSSILGNDGMWAINKTFLDQQIAHGKMFVFTVTPESISKTSFTHMEYDHLLKSGYKFMPKDGMYHANKK